MKQIYKIVKFDKPVRKSYKDVEKYDVARFEYGDYDNWVDGIILDIKVRYDENNNANLAEVHFTYTFGMDDTCFTEIRNDIIDFDFIGKAEKLENDKEKDEQEAPMSM